MNRKVLAEIHKGKSPMEVITNTINAANIFRKNGNYDWALELFQSYNRNNRWSNVYLHYSTKSPKHQPIIVPETVSFKNEVMIATLSMDNPSIFPDWSWRIFLLWNITPENYIIDPAKLYYDPEDRSRLFHALKKSRSGSVKQKIKYVGYDRQYEFDGVCHISIIPDNKCRYALEIKNSPTIKIRKDVQEYLQDLYSKQHFIPNDSILNNSCKFLR